MDDDGIEWVVVNDRPIDEGVLAGRDAIEAVKYFRMAAEQGYAPAQAQLGFMYARGWFWPLSPSEST